MYLDRLDGLGRNLPHCVTNSPSGSSSETKSKKSRALRKHEESSTALLSSLTSSVQTCKKDLQRVNQYVDASRRHQQQGAPIFLEPRLIILTSVLFVF